MIDAPTNPSPGRSTARWWRAPAIRGIGRHLPRLRLPITSTLLVGFGGVVAAAVIAVAIIFIRAGSENTQALLELAGQQRLNAAIGGIERYLKPAADDVSFLAGQLSAQDDIGLDEDARIKMLLRGSLGAAPQIEGLAFVRANFLSVIVARNRSTPDGVDSVSSSLADSVYIKELMEAARRIKTGAGKDKEKDYAWMPVHYVKDLGVSYLGAVAPIRHRGTFEGFVIATVPVNELSRLIALPPTIEPARKATPTPTGEESEGTVFILNAGDEVVAHPYLAGDDFTPTESRYQLRRTELPDPVLQALWSPPAPTLADSIVRLLVRTSPQRRLVTVNGKSYVVLLQQETNFSPQPWTVGVQLPLTAVSEFGKRLLQALVVAASILVVALLLALLLGRSLARPIKRLAGAAAAVSAFDFSGKHPLAGSPFRELDAAGRAWDSMLSALRWFESYVPRALVGQLLHQAAHGELKAEEREVTVMFSDIVGFSAIALRHTPASLATFLNRHFGLIGRQVAEQQGAIDKYIGDSVMAFWGAPALDPQHALHGARAALGVAETLTADNRRRAKKGLAPVRIRIGLHTGPAIVGNVGAPGRVNYTLIGEMVNTAQRLEQLGRAFDDGQASCIVLASAALVAHLPPEIPRQALGDQTLKGMGDIAVYRLGESPPPPS